VRAKTKDKSHCSASDPLLHQQKLYTVSAKRVRLQITRSIELEKCITHSKFLQCTKPNACPNS